MFLHHVAPGAAGRSYGIEVARIAGLPDVVLRRAFELLGIFEKDGLKVKDIPAPLPQIALKRQIMLLSPESDGIIEELAQIDTDNITPMEALKILHRLKEKSQNTCML